MPPITSYISLGSNLNNPIQQIQQAIKELDQLSNTALMKVSNLYVTTPVGHLDQPDFINAVAAISTQLTPHRLLAELQAIEQLHHRERLIHWGARTLDLDILLFADTIMQTDDLILPHPEIPHRAFVLYPLSELVPINFTLPKWGSLQELLKACPKEGINTL